MKKLTGKKESLSLRRYMESRPDGLGMEDAAAMLLAVALQLRDLHNSGTAHLQVSPDSVLIGSKGATLRPATSAETDRYTSGYAAPEIYRGVSAGNLSDIYSFCAVLSFAATGKHPANALARTDSGEPDGAAYPDPAFAQLIQTGMAPEASERFATMQDVILKLSAYNVRPFSEQTEGKRETERKTLELPRIRLPKIKLSEIPFLENIMVRLRIRMMDIQPKKIAFIAAAVVPMVLACIYAACYNGAKNHAETGDFTAAEKLVVVPAITKWHDPQLLVYLDGLKLLDEGSYAEANGTFESVSGYLDADELAQKANFLLAQGYAENKNFELAFEIMGQLHAGGYEGADEELNRLYYEFALYCAQKNDFDTALEVMTQLQEKGYADADYKIGEFHYSWGSSLLREKDYSDAYDEFAVAAALGYAGAEEMLQEVLYQEVIALLSEKEHLDAYEKLKSISGYRDVDSAIKSLEENMYKLAKSYYRSGKYDLAKSYFTALSVYEDSLKYRQLISARSTSGSSFLSDFLVKNAVDTLVGMFYFEDASQILLSNDAMAQEFLRGRWTGGGYYFNMTEEGQINYNLPWFSYGDHYRITNGEVQLYYEDSENKTRSLFYIEASSPTCISVFCYQDGSYHTLYLE